METSRTRLNAKEQLIVKLISEGMTSPRIAEELCLSLPAIKWYRKRIRAKFNATTTVEAIRKAIEQGYL